MPCEVVVCGFYFMQHSSHKDGCDVKGTTLWILKPLLVNPWLKTCKRYSCAAQIFMVQIKTFLIVK